MLPNRLRSSVHDSRELDNIELDNIELDNIDLGRAADRRFGFPALLAVLAWGAVVGCESAPSPNYASEITARRTNVLLIVIDTLRADHLGAWGYPFDTSPNLDRLAATGLQFSQTFANCSWTRPSMASMLTGLYPRETGVHEERYDRLPDEMVTLAERFTAAGYLSLGLTSNANINTYFGFEQGFAAYGDSAATWKWMGEEPAKRHGELDDAKRTTERTVELVDRHRGALSDQPFFLQVLYIDPHNPYEEHFWYGVDSESPGYDSEIRYTDQHVQRLIDELGRRGLMDDTLVVITSDHGEGLGSQRGLPLANRHGETLYDSVLHVPLIFWHPSLAPQRIDDLTELLDVTPTLVSLLGLEPATFHGRALVPYERAGAIDAVVSETDWRQVAKRSLRTRELRFVLNDDVLKFQLQRTHEGRRLSQPRRRAFRITGPEELYKRVPGQPEDPLTTNSAGDHPREAKVMRDRLETWRSATPYREPVNRSGKDVITTRGVSRPEVKAVETDDMSDADREQLRALGYLED